MLWVTQTLNAIRDGYVDPTLGWTFVLCYIAPFVTAPLSFMSSLYILFRLLRKSNRKNLRSRPKEHLLAGLCTLDACASFGLSFSSTPAVANGHNNVVHPHIKLPQYGTIATCNAQGFLAELGFGVPLYNQALAVYFILSVVFSMRDRVVMKWVVPAFHVFNLGFILTSAVVALFLKLYNPAGVLGCWIHPRTHRSSKEKAELFEMLLGIVPVAISATTVMVSMTVLSVAVWCTERRSLRRSMRAAGREFSLTRRTVEAGILYSLSFLLVWLPVFLQAIGVFHPRSTAYQVLRVIVAFMTPSQGIFNLLIFTLPKWRAWFQNCVPNCRSAFRQCREREATTGSGDIPLSATSQHKIDEERLSDLFNHGEEHLGSKTDIDMTAGERRDSARRDSIIKNIISAEFTNDATLEDAVRKSEIDDAPSGI